MKRFACPTPFPAVRNAPLLHSALLIGKTRCCNTRSKALKKSGAFCKKRFFYFLKAVVLPCANGRRRGCWPGFGNCPIRRAPFARRSGGVFTKRRIAGIINRAMRRGKTYLYPCGMADDRVPGGMCRAPKRFSLENRRRNCGRVRHSHGFRFLQKTPDGIILVKPFFLCYNTNISIKGGHNSV